MQKLVSHTSKQVKEGQHSLDSPVPRLTMQERNVQIGAALKALRLEQGVSKTACAETLGMGRARYAAIEAGTSLVTVTQVEWLARLFRLPQADVWLRVLAGAEPTPGTEPLDSTLLVTLQPGQRIVVATPPLLPAPETVIEPRDQGEPGRPEGGGNTR